MRGRSVTLMPKWLKAGATVDIGGSSGEGSVFGGDGEAPRAQRVLDGRVAPLALDGCARLPLAPVEDHRDGLAGELLLEVLEQLHVGPRDDEQMTEAYQLLRDPRRPVADVHLAEHGHGPPEMLLCQLAVAE